MALNYLLRIFPLGSTGPLQGERGGFGLVAVLISLLQYSRLSIFSPVELLLKNQGKKKYALMM